MPDELVPFEINKSYIDWVIKLVDELLKRKGDVMNQSSTQPNAQAQTQVTAFHPAWLNVMLRVLAAVPSAVLGAQAIATNAPGATKKDIAMASINVAGLVAQTAIPESKQAVAAATAAASNLIDAVVEAFKHPQGNSIATDIIPPSASAQTNFDATQGVTTRVPK